MKFNSTVTSNLLLATCAILIYISCSTSSKIQPLPTKPSAISFQLNVDYTLTEVLEKAESEGKLVFVDFYASWCLPCQLMDEEVFNKKEVFEYFNEHFVSYKVDVEKTNGANLKLLFQADELPTMLFLDKNGRVIQRNAGSLSQTALLNLARIAVGL